MMHFSTYKTLYFTPHTHFKQEPMIIGAFGPQIKSIASCNPLLPNLVQALCSVSSLLSCSRSMTLLGTTGGGVVGVAVVVEVFPEEKLTAPGRGLTLLERTWGGRVPPPRSLWACREPAFVRVW